MVGSKWCWPRIDVYTHAKVDVIDEKIEVVG